jgi:hypothetical protein
LLLSAYALVGDVGDLVTAGTLGNGEANALTSKLENSIKQMDRGNANAATNQLMAFINQVDALIKSGRLSQAQGQSLIDAANTIIAKRTP